MLLYFHDVIFHLKVQLYWHDTGTPCCIALCFIVLHRYCTFYRSKFCGSPESGKSAGVIFPTVFAHFVSLCHMLVILTVSQPFSLLLLHLSWWSMIRHHWCFYCYGLGHREPSPCKAVNFIDKHCVCSGCSMHWLFPHLPPSPWASLFPETQQYWD